MTAVSKPKTTVANDAEVLAMLKRYNCPTPFHEVRTRFLGNIASPVPGASPLETVKQLWVGEFQPFDNIDEVNALLAVLVNGLWNRLTEHQNSRNPFMLTRFEVKPTRESLHHYVLVRRQEIDGFVIGLFGDERQIDLPERAHESLDVLADLRSMVAGAVDLLDDLSKTAEPGSLQALVRNIQQMTIIAEKEMNKINLACKRARVQYLEQIPTERPTLH